MKLLVLIENLQKHLPLLYRGVSTRSQLPVLLNILLVAKNGKFFIKSTDLEIGIEAEIPANIKKEGGTTVPARKFYDLISSLPHGKITLSLEGKTLEIVGEKTKSSLQTISMEEFPALYEEKGAEIINLTTEEFNKNITSVVFAASTDVVRPALSGVLVKKEGSNVFFVATDGYRLSLKQYQKETKGEVALLIPSRIIRELLSIKETGKIVLYVAKNSNQIICSYNEINIVGRLIEAEYPNYQKIIPTTHTTKITFNKDEVEKAVKIASVFAREAANVVKFVVQKNILRVSSSAPSVGENTVEVEVQLEGEENQIAFNARYLLDLFGSIHEEQMALEITGPLNPGVFKLPTDSSFIHLIMPIRAQE